MTGRVVVELEVIDVDHQHRHRQLAAATAAPAVFQPLVEPATVEDAGEPVDGRQVAESVGLGLQRQMGLHPRPHHWRAERLGYEVHRTGIQTLALLLGRILPGQEDQRNVATFQRGLQLAAEFQPAQSRYDDVGQDQVRPLAFGQLHGLLGAGGDKDLVDVAENLEQRMQVQRLIIDQQQSGALDGGWQVQGHHVRVSGRSGSQS